MPSTETIIADARARRNRGNWDIHWDDLARVHLPRRLGFASQTIEGDKRTEELYDGTPMQAARGLANAYGGLIRPIGIDWFHLKFSDKADADNEAAVAWLDNFEKLLREAFENPRSRFAQATREADLDLVVFGTAILFTGIGETGDHLTFEAIHLKDGYPVFDARGNVVGMYRWKNPTLRQAEIEFGLENLSPASQKLILERKYEDRVEILHAVVRREEGFKGAAFAKGMPLASLWIEVEAEWTIKESGFQDIPFIVPRFDTSSGEEYGRSPAMIALPDSNTLQAMGETLLIAGNRAADPTILAPSDSFIDAPNMWPGGMAYYEADAVRDLGANPIRSLDIGANMPLTLQMQQDMRLQVFAAFMRNVLNLPVSGPDMTAFEVAERKEEFIREIGPIFAAAKSDYNQPLVEIPARNLLRTPGAVPPPPEGILSGGLRIEFEDPISRLRKQIDAAAASAWADRQLARAAVVPSAADVVNLDEVARFEAEAENLPDRVVQSTDTVRRTREDRQQAEQQQSEIDTAQQIAEVGATAGKIPGIEQATGGGQ